MSYSKCLFIIVLRPWSPNPIIPLSHLIEKLSDNICEVKIMRWNAVKCNNQCGKGIRESFSECKNDVLVNDRDSSRLKLEGSVFDVRYP